MIKHLYVNGDSFSFGQELGGSDVDPGQFYVHTPYMAEVGYCGLLQKHYGIPECTNRSLPGGSNDRIFRMTIQDVTKLLTTHQPEELFVHLCMTEPSRREFYNHNKQDWYVHLNNHKPHGDEFVALWKPYVAYFDTQFEAANRYLTQLHGLQAFLKHKKIPHLITHSLVSPDVSRWYYVDVDPVLIDTIDRRTCPFFEFNTFAVQYKIANPGRELIGKLNHPLEEIHQAWAQYLIRYIDENKLLQG